MKEPQYVTDADGNRTGVILDLMAYRQMLEALEDADAMQAYDAALVAQAEDEMIPFEQAVTEIETQWSEWDRQAK